MPKDENNAFSLFRVRDSVRIYSKENGPFALVSKGLSWKMLSTNFTQNSCQIPSFSFFCVIVPKIPFQGETNQCLPLLLSSQLQTQARFCKSSL